MLINTLFAHISIAMQLFRNVSLLNYAIQQATQILSLYRLLKSLLPYKEGLELQLYY